MGHRLDSVVESDIDFDDCKCEQHVSILYSGFGGVHYVTILTFPFCEQHLFHDMIQVTLV